MSYGEFESLVKKVSQGEIGFGDFVRGETCKNYLGTIHRGDDTWPAYPEGAGKWGSLFEDRFCEGQKSEKVLRLGIGGPKPVIYKLESFNRQSPA